MIEKEEEFFTPHLFNQLNQFHAYDEQFITQPKEKKIENGI